jgi:putative transposase
MRSTCVCCPARAATIDGRSISSGFRPINRAARSRDGSADERWEADAAGIAGKKHWLWRAVDQDGFVLDVLVQSRRDKEAAKRLFRKLLKKQGRAPRVLVTDKLKSYAADKREIMPGVEHRQHKGLNNRAPTNAGLLRGTEAPRPVSADVFAPIP